MYELYFYIVLNIIITIITIINLNLIYDILDKKIDLYSLNFLIFLYYSSFLLSNNYYNIWKTIFKRQLRIYEILNEYEFIMNNILLIIFLIQSYYFIDDLTVVLKENHVIYYLNLLIMISIMFFNFIFNSIIIVYYFVYKFNNNFQYTYIV